MDNIVKKRESTVDDDLSHMKNQSRVRESGSDERENESL